MAEPERFLNSPKLLVERRFVCFAAGEAAAVVAVFVCGGFGACLAVDFDEVFAGELDSIDV